MNDLNNEKDSNDVIEFVRQRTEKAFEMESIDSLNISYGALLLALHIQIITIEEFETIYNEILQYTRILQQSKKNKKKSIAERAEDFLDKYSAFIVITFWIFLILALLTIIGITAVKAALLIIG